MMRKRNSQLRSDFESAVLAAIEQHGEGFDRGPLIQAAIDGGVSQASAYRWLSAILESRNGAGGNAAAGPASFVPVAAAAKPLATAPVEPSPPPGVPMPTGGGSPPSASWAEIMAAVAQGERDTSHALDQARSPDRRARDWRSLLLASNHLRRALETAVKFVEAVVAQPGGDGFRSDVAADAAAVAHGLREGVCRRMLDFGNTPLGDRACL